MNHNLQNPKVLKYPGTQNFMGHFDESNRSESYSLEAMKPCFCKNNTISQTIEENTLSALERYRHHQLLQSTYTKDKSIKEEKTYNPSYSDALYKNIKDWMQMVFKGLPEEKQMPELKPLFQTAVEILTKDPRSYSIFQKYDDIQNIFWAWINDALKTYKDPSYSLTQDHTIDVKDQDPTQNIIERLAQSFVDMEKEGKTFENWEPFFKAHIKREEEIQNQKEKEFYNNLTPKILGGEDDPYKVLSEKLRKTEKSHNKIGKPKEPVTLKESSKNLPDKQETESEKKTHNPQEVYQQISYRLRQKEKEKTII